MCRSVAIRVATQYPLFQRLTHPFSLTATSGATMKSAKIPHLYIRNGIYYYRNNSVWKSLRTHCKKEAFRRLSFALFGTPPAVNDNTTTVNYSSVASSDAKLTPHDTHETLSTSKLIKAYLDENGGR